MTAAAQELRRRPSHRWPATTPSRNRACLGLWIGRSNAESVERHSTAKYAEAVHQYDNGEQSRHQRDPPTTCQLSVEIGETLGANCRCQRLCALPTSWQAFAQIHPHRTRPPAQWTSEHAAVAQENHVLSRYHAPACFPKRHYGPAGTRNIPSVTVVVLVLVSLATTALACPEYPMRKPMREVRCGPGRSLF